MAIWDFRYLKDSDNQIKYAQISAIDPDDPDIKMFVPNFPVQNMAFLPANKPAKVRNRVGTTNGVVKIHFSFPAAITADLLALVGHNFSSDATITVYEPCLSCGVLVSHTSISSLRLMTRQIHTEIFRLVMLLLDLLHLQVLGMEIILYQRQRMRQT